MFNQRTPFFDKFNKWKVGTPVGGGILIIIVTTILTLWSYGILSIPTKGWELFVVFFGFISFGLLGLYDDWKKLADPKKTASFFGLRFRHKFIIQWVLALIIASVFYYKLGYSFLFIHGLGLVGIGIFFIPFAAFVIVSFVNAVNITDGLDGLTSGLLVICLVGFWQLTLSKLINHWEYLFRFCWVRLWPFSTLISIKPEFGLGMSERFLWERLWLSSDF